MILLKLPKIGLGKTFLSSDLRISKNTLQIEEAKVPKFNFMHTLSKSKSIFAIEQIAIVSCCIFIVSCCMFNVAFLLGHAVGCCISIVIG